ncbi:MAG: hypothetical protein M0P16_00485 [Syntrophales bacterium]|jgi:hypothetical protein|nr:hypothetical protein [Syntrophales bacterium]MCK9390263.1 hypothetical protein [Syntrophales bacterium]
MNTRSYMATHDLIAVSAYAKETAINTEQTLDLTLLCALGDIPNLEYRRENNESEATGKEEPDTIYDLGATANLSMNFEKAQPQHFAFLTSYGLGVSTPAAAGTGGYQHTNTPIDGDLDADRSLPSFTFAVRYGKTVLKRLFASGFVDSLTATFARDSWVKLTGSIKATGKKTDNVVEETVNAYIDGTSLTLAALGVEGADAATRLNNVQRIKVELATGVWTEVAYSAVSDAAPAVITITAPGAAHTLKDFKILYIAAESGSAWMTFPARVNETPLRVSEMTVIVGGVWGGSAFTGGRELQAEMKSIEWSFNNNMEISFVPGGGGAYASRAQRGGRTQKIKLDREFREFILQQHMELNDTLGLYILAEGAWYDGTSHKYQVEIIFPKVGVLSAPIAVDGKRLGESGDLQVLEDDTYGSVIVKVKNKQAAYAA